VATSFRSRDSSRCCGSPRQKSGERGMSWAPVGMAASLGLWLLAGLSAARAQACAIDDLPESWCGNPVVTSVDDDRRTPQLAQWLRSWRSVAPWVAAVLATFVVLELAGISAPVQIAATVGFAAYLGHATREHEREELRALTEQAGVPALPRRHWLAVWYGTSLYATWLFILLAAFFAVQTAVAAW
jgi:hypothetical protein